MITGLRAAVLCTGFDEETGGDMNYLGVVSESVAAESVPGAVGLWLAIQVTLDRKGADASIRLKAKHFSRKHPLKIPPGWRVASMALPLGIPIFDEGQLELTIIDEGRGGRSFKATWDLVVHDDAERIEATVEEIVGLAAQFELELAEASRLSQKPAGTMN